MLDDLQAKMEDLKQQIASRGASEKERANAKKSHKMRFIERQRTTRLFKQLTSQSEQNDSQRLYALALDQVYVAHYPLDHSSYLNLYQNNKRRSTMNRRLLYKMASQRQRVLERLASDCTQRVNWIPAEQYERIADVKTWSTDLERSTFGITVTDDKGSTAPKNAQPTDSRFTAVSDRAQKLVEQQEQMEQAMIVDGEDLLREETNATASDNKSLDDDDSGSAGSSSGEDDADPLAKSTARLPRPQETPVITEKGSKEGEDDVSSSSSSSDDDDDDTESSRNSNESASQNKNQPGGSLIRKHPSTAAEKSSSAPVKLQKDDFLVSAVDDDGQNNNVFANAKRHVPAVDDARGDKSQGWATQRQLPGQFRKKQRRR